MLSAPQGRPLQRLVHALACLPPVAPLLVVSTTPPSEMHFPLSSCQLLLRGQSLHLYA
ncbi:uncharacterized protein PSFLO_06781 [Pseudozyma flocculosa]|uniref:Uncharacterized protein n=1 Tax=Pseudozyma flocculosa TaxID=84751 RepID=A0A5C3FD68_9BASI|nr:uncharacterized protein PSFLO_06781 [Pseudozyma flocculosa]